MAERENDSESSSALPKLLLEIVSQVDAKESNAVENNQEAEHSVTEDMPIQKSGINICCV